MLQIHGLQTVKKEKNQTVNPIYKGERKRNRKKKYAVKKAKCSYMMSIKNRSTQTKKNKKTNPISKEELLGLYGDNSRCRVVP